MDNSNGITDLTLAPDVREVVSEDGAVLLDIKQGICFSLNPVGLKIWDLLKRRCSLEQIVDALGTEFPVPPDQLRSDASEFIEALRTKGLLHRVGERDARKPGLLRGLFRRSILSEGLGPKALLRPPDDERRPYVNDLPDD